MRGEFLTFSQAALALSAAIYFASVAFYPPYYCYRFIKTLGWRTAISISLFWLPILIMTANIRACTDFSLL